MSNYFKENLKFLREERKLSKNKLGELAGVNQTTIGRWENGEITPTIDNVIDLMNALNVPIDKLGDFLGKDLKTLVDVKNNEYDDELKQLETDTGIKISYSTEKELTQEDYLAINELVLNEIKSQKEEDKK